MAHRDVEQQVDGAGGRGDELLLAELAARERAADERAEDELAVAERGAAGITEEGSARKWNSNSSSGRREKKEKRSYCNRNLGVKTSPKPPLSFPPENRKLLTLECSKRMFRLHLGCV